MVALSLVLAFGLEVCTLIALGFWGVHAGQSTPPRIVLGIGAPLLAAVVWGTFLSPKAAVLTVPPLQLSLKLAVFALGVAALFATGHPYLGVILGTLALAVTFERLLGFYGSNPSLEARHRR